MRPSPVAALLLASLLVACTLPPRNVVAPGHEGAPGVRTFVVCAPNTVLSLVPELENGVHPVHEDIEAYLRSHGFEVQSLDRDPGRRLWKDSLEQARREGAVEMTAAIFADALARHADFEAIVMPSILLHSVYANNGEASWDGVRRRMRLVNAPPRPIGRDQDSFANRVAESGVSGEVAVTSLQMLVYTRQGELIFGGQGGLDFVHEVELSDDRSAHNRLSFHLRIQVDLFDDAEKLRNSVEIAFQPYLTPPDER